MLVEEQNATLPFVVELEENIQGEVLSDSYSLGMYATDASFYQITPLAVVLPKDAADVKKAVEIARKYKIQILIGNVFQIQIQNTSLLMYFNTKYF